MYLIKKRCYFYGEYTDMGGNVPVCAYRCAQGNLPCEGCKAYISNSEVSEFVRFLVYFREKYMTGEDRAPSITEAISKLNGLQDAAKRAGDALRRVTTNMREEERKIEMQENLNT